MSTVISKSENYVQVDLGTLPPKAFGTGSVGWFESEKVDIDGVRYQCNWQAVIAGSKNTGEDVPADGLKLGVQALAKREFKSGSTGYFTSTRITVPYNGKLVGVQMQLQMVAIGSKPSTAAEKAEKLTARIDAEYARLAELEAKKAAVLAAAGLA